MSEDRTPAAARQAIQRARICAVPGCGRMTLAERCDRHRAPAGERAIAARARDEQERERAKSAGKIKDQRHGVRRENFKKEAEE